jgi:hypothetical protein
MAEPATRTPREEAALERLDALTPYYRRQMPSLPGQQKRVACALAGTDRPMGSAETARASRMEPRAAATTLTRLRENGTVLHTGRSWAPADAWLGAWHRMRRGDLSDLPDRPLPERPSRRDRPHGTSC